MQWLLIGFCDVGSAFKKEGELWYASPERIVIHEKIMSL